MVAAGCFAPAALAALAMHRFLTGPQFEGYSFLIALARILQVSLTWLTLARDASSSGTAVSS